ncbi:MAG: D-inositol-3-phosphate glycosyltransferase [Eubacterium sp.]|uniref:glycosyltransferase family 4 protein n=1 Tax=Eubacterium sp. TaxID=142586 RepID=UPI00305B00C1
MRILQVIKTNNGANWAFEQAKFLFEKYGIEIITVLPDEKEGMAQKYKEAKMPVVKGDFSLPIKQPWLLRKRIKNIKKLVDLYQPDIIHTHFVTNILMLRIALRSRNIPRIFQVPGPLHLENFFFKKVDVCLSNKNDFWIGTCKKTCEIYLKENICKDKVFLTYYSGYGGKTCDTYEKSTNILHKEFSLSNNDILVGMVAYFYAPKRYLFQKRGLKGHEDFIDAIHLVRKKNKNVKGIIIGRAWDNAEWYEKKVKDYAEKKCGDGIIFTGFRGDMQKIYRELDIAVHPSHSENLGGAAESLAAGVPTIATNVGGFPDIVIDNQTGLLCKMKNAEDLSAKINYAITYMNLMRCYAQEGKELVRDLLDINSCCERIYHIYQKVLGES